MVWDINTKFLPVEDHNRRQLLTKFEGSWCAQIWISCQNILKLKWAWRAQFLSYAFQILQKCITFEDAQMILLALLKILSLNRIFKKSIQLLVHTGAVLDSLDNFVPSDDVKPKDLLVFVRPKNFSLKNQKNCRVKNENVFVSDWLLSLQIRLIYSWYLKP